MPDIDEEYGGRVILTTEQKNYNHQRSRSRIVVEVAFGWLKQRFRCLKKPLNRRGTGQIRNCDNIVSAIVLHNLLIDLKAGNTFQRRDRRVGQWKYKEIERHWVIDQDDADRTDCRRIRDGYARFFFDNQS